MCGRRRRVTPLLAMLFTHLHTGVSLSVVPPRFAGWTAPQWNAAHDHFKSSFISRDIQAIAKLHITRWLDPLTIDMHQATCDRIGGLLSTLEKSYLPQPLVQA
jgi:hypothetical protein